MTDAQKAALKNDITVTHGSTVYQGQTLLSYWNGNNMEALAAYYNTVASPQVDLWRPNILPSEVIPVIVMSEYIALTAVKQNGLLLYMQGVYIDATNVNTRNGFASIFTSGTSLTNLTALAKKAATNFENLFTSNNVSSVFGQVVTPSDIFSAK